MPVFRESASQFKSRFVAVAAVVFIGVTILLFGDHTDADKPGYRFVSVRTILGPCCADAGLDLTVDSDGGVLLAGYRGGLDLDRDGSIDIQTFGSPDPLIRKTYDDNVRGWVQGPGGPKRDAANGIASDRRGGVYAVGEFTQSMRIAGGTIRAKGRTDGFLARYAPDGETLWAKPIGGPDHDGLYDVASDEAGNAFVVGTIRGAVDVDRDGSIDVTAAGESAALLASFAPDGRLRWAWASKGTARTQCRAITIGLRSEIYIGGHYMKGNLDLDGDGTEDVPRAAVPDSSTVNTPQADLNGYYARFDGSGKMVWARAVSGPAVQLVGSLAMAGNGDLLVLGWYTGPADLDGDGSADIEFRTLGNRRFKHHADGNGFLLRVAPAGEKIWARRYTANVNHVAADATRIALSGSYTGPLDLDDDGKPEREADPDEWLEGFAAILDGEGRVRHVFTIVGGDSDVVNATAFSPDGKKLYATGYTKLGADFDGDGKIETASACHQLGDLYIARYNVED